MSVVPHTDFAFAPGELVMIKDAKIRARVERCTWDMESKIYHVSYWHEGHRVEVSCYSTEIVLIDE